MFQFKLIEAKFGLIEFAVVVKLRQKIYGGRGCYCEWTKEVALLFSRELGLGGNAVSEIISAALRRGLFDKRLFEAVERQRGLEVQKQYLLVCVANN